MFCGHGGNFWLGHNNLGTPGDGKQTPVVVTNLSSSHRGDMTVESPQVLRILLSQVAFGTGEVSWWASSNGSISWSRESYVIRKPNSSFQVNALVRNAHPDGRVVVNESADGVRESCGIYRFRYFTLARLSISNLRC